MDNIIIISGLLRSGTSMIMQMMQAGGLKVIFDKEKSSDNNDPFGYYEIQNMTLLLKEKDWLLNCKGKVIKVLSDLLLRLSPDFNYDIIFINRSLIEIFQSISKLKFDMDLSIKCEYNMTFKNIQKYRDYLQKVNSWIDNQPNIRKLDVNYNKLIKNPNYDLNNIKEFLDMDLDLEKMKSVINPKLYRNRIKDISKTPYSIPQNKRMNINNVYI